MEIDSLVLTGGTLKNLRLPQKAQDVTPGKNELFRGASGQPIEVVSDFVPPVQGYRAVADHTEFSTGTNTVLTSGGNDTQLRGKLRLVIDKSAGTITGVLYGARRAGGYSNITFRVELAIWRLGSAFLTSSPYSAWSHLKYTRFIASDMPFSTSSTTTKFVTYSGEITAGVYMLIVRGTDQYGNNSSMRSGEYLDLRVEIDDAGQILRTYAGGAGSPAITYTNTEQ